MSYLKIYQWERQAFPWQHSVHIKPQWRRRLTQELAKHWGLGHVSISETSRGGGRAWPQRNLIMLPSPNYRWSCPLSLIVHELAHLYDFKHYGGNGHRASFKKSVIKLYVEVRAYRLLPPIFAQMRREDAEAKERAVQAMATATKRALRTEMVKQVKKTVPYKLQQVQARQKRLRTRIKRLQTALKKADRQARTLEKRLGPPEVVEHAGEWVTLLGRIESEV